MKAKTSKKKKKRGGYKRGVYVSAKSGQTFKYRSGWELAYMQFLDTAINVMSWHYELLAIEYVSNKKTGKIRKYYPDFTVTYDDGSMKVIEIKPKRKLMQAAVVKKLLAAKEWCRTHNATYEILTEIELKQLSLI